MSGIAGIIRLDGAPVAQGDLAAMLSPMRRRGPDRQQSLIQGNVGFGQALLATTPEATAEFQPWTHRETGCIVVSDSRLDNRADLLRTLGTQDRAADEIGDGELLHTAYQHWGQECTKHLLGDFAFALWDPRHQVLMCARDIMGVRPFYFHHAPGRLFAFASECDAILTISGVSSQIDEGRVADALIGETEGIDRTSTFYLSVKRLPPARVLVLRGQSITQAEYWQPLTERPKNLPQSDDAWADAIGSTLREAVRCRLRSSQRVASMLSGGLDSSSVCAIADELRASPTSERFATFSAIDSQGQGAETEAISAMLASRDFDATVVDLYDLGDIAPQLRDQLRALREPFDGTMSLVSAVYAAAQLKGIRCVLDGVPADNLYSAGPWHQQLARSGHLHTFWREACALYATHEYARPNVRTAKALVGALAPHALRQRWERLQDDRLLHKLTRHAFISPQFVKRTALRERYRQMRADMHATRLHNQDWTAHSTMTAAYITAGVERYNRVASYFSIEPRHPFLDRRVIELHAWLPPSLRLRGGRYKWVLRHAMRGLLPGAVAWRRDKEHLGYRFSPAIWGGLTWPSDLASLPLLCDAVGLENLEAIQRRLPPASDPGGRMLTEALALMAWAMRTRSSADLG